MWHTDTDTDTYSNANGNSDANAYTHTYSKAFINTTAATDCASAAYWVTNRSM